MLHIRDILATRTGFLMVTRRHSLENFKSRLKTSWSTKEKQTENASNFRTVIVTAVAFLLHFFTFEQSQAPVQSASCELTALICTTTP